MSSKLSPALSNTLLACFAFYGMGGAYYAAILPRGQWRSHFSWHPFLMVLAFVGLFGSSAIIKKLGGYTNTKLHGILAWLATLAALAGWYSVYQYKEQAGANHLTSLHSMAGLVVLVSCLVLGVVGGVALHPDFGIDKTNKTIRYVHKMAARAVLIAAWGVAFSGLSQLTTDMTTKLIFAVPLVVLLPFSLL